MRLNLSKSGMGASVGVKGLRLTAPAKGATYVTAGKQGFYYRQTLRSNPQTGTVQPPSNQSFEPQAGVIQTADAADLVGSSNARLIEQLNERARFRNPAPLAFILSVAAALLGLIATQPLWFVGAATFFALGMVLKRRYNQKRETRLFYQLDDTQTANFNIVCQAFSHLSQSLSVWRVQSRAATTDLKRNAGASSLVNRALVGVGKLQIPHVNTNVNVMGVDIRSIKIFFLPDVIVYWQANTFAAIPYSDLRVVPGRTRFIEEDKIPTDATIVGHTWRYLNKSGGPDRRFNNNRQLLIAEYGTLELTTPTGLNILLQTSSGDKALAFANCLNERLSRR